MIAIVCLTGAILVFEKEMQMFIYPERYKVASPGTEAVSLQQMITALQTKEPSASVSSVKIYSDPEHNPCDEDEQKHRSTDTHNQFAGVGG